MTASHPASARFIAGKLLRFFVHPEPTTLEIDALAKLYQAQNRHLGDTLRVLLKSRLFFSARARRSRIKSPVDFVVGLVRSLGAQASPRELAREIGRMGQTLLEPPNVAGWKGERAWITSATWLMRANFAAQLFDERYKVRPAAAELLPQEDPTGRADAALELLLDGGVDRATRAAIRAVARRSPSRPNLLHAIMCLPEAQLL